MKYTKWEKKDDLKAREWMKMLRLDGFNSAANFVGKMLCTIHKLQKERDDTMQSEDDLQCSIASALGWDTHGLSFDECVRRIVAGDEKLRLKCKEGLNYLPPGMEKK
jgi:hypothetical protein